MKGSLRSGMLAIPFPFALAFELEAHVAQKSLCAYKNASFSFCNSKVGDFAVNLLTHSVALFFILHGLSPLVASLHRVTIFNFCSRLRCSAPINCTFSLPICGIFSCHLACKIGQSSTTLSKDLQYLQVVVGLLQSLTKCPCCL